MVSQAAAIEILSADRLSVFGLYSQFRMVYDVCLSVCLSVSVFGFNVFERSSPLTSFRLTSLNSCPRMPILLTSFAVFDPDDDCF
jgi:predicted metal-binding membrane protein